MITWDCPRCAFVNQDTDLGLHTQACICRRCGLTADVSVA